MNLVHVMIILGPQRIGLRPMVQVLVPIMRYLFNAKVSFLYCFIEDNQLAAKKLWEVIITQVHLMKIRQL